MNRFLVFVSITLMIACNSEGTVDELPSDWEGIVASASNSSVTMMMWQGDPLINGYMQDYVIPQLREKHRVELEIVDGQGNYIVRTLMAEKDAGVDKSEIDVIWINGETFYQLRQLDAIYGPFTDLLPNAKYIDWNNPFINKDFQQPVNGFECPWGNVQLTLIYDSLHVPVVPQTLEAMKYWIKENPGRFSIGNDFTGMTLLKSWMIALYGDKEAFEGGFSETLYSAASEKLWSYLREIRPYLWNNGETFPSSVAQMHQLFAQGELWFTMSNNDSEVDNKILKGIFSSNARAFVPAYGTIQNSHYLGIPAGSGNKAGAMVAINFLISPEAQLQKMRPDVWGDHTVLNLADSMMQGLFSEIPGRRFAPSRSEIEAYAIQEPAAEYMIRLYDDFREKIIEQ